MKIETCSLEEFDACQRRMHLKAVKRLAWRVGTVFVGIPTFVVLAVLALRHVHLIG